ncbi:MAG: methionyl-tRNA formyltransferase [Parcubacteria group bacterium Gr01-1014_17]|nr:MAG: methionyl-tRNA formyltransferase [Parcubacteria group bacterium Gr01-1014_17]
MIKFVFFGTDDFSSAVLEELKKSGLIPALIVTVPDRPKGRGLALTPPPVKLWAQEHKIESLQPEKLGQEFATILQSMRVDCFVVASYGKIIPKEILDIPEKGALNVHPSLLPKYRGASPIESQILADEKEVGVTIMLMDEKMDHGPTLASWKLETGNWKVRSAPDVVASSATRRGGGIAQTSGAKKLKKRLAEEGGKLLAETIPKWMSGEIKAVPQDESKATYTKKITKKDGLLDLAGDPYQNFLRIRAYDGSVGTYFLKNNKRVIIKEARFENLPAQAGGKLIITRVIQEGKKEMDYNVGFSAGSGAMGRARQIL